ncbi:uncharacterized protein LOC111271429 isoform X2 [Varroa jacobsoni]|nr:uncharacterized protein LOC111271429 isoform X2 [Varroa jacobsoni]
MANPPESCYFAFMMGIHTGLMFVTVWAVYETRPNSKSIHAWACIVGYLASAGGLLSATFQGNITPDVHTVGEIMRFTLIPLYIWLIRCSSRYMKVLRVFCALITTASFPVIFILDIQAVCPLQRATKLCWTQKGDAYYLNMASVTTEWVFVTTTIVFIVSLATDIREIKSIRAKNIRPGRIRRVRREWKPTEVMSDMVESSAASDIEEQDLLAKPDFVEVHPNADLPVSYEPISGNVTPTIMPYKVPDDND